MNILERLKSKIIDIDKLERDKENIDCYNWLIKAIIKGDMLREIGVVYKGQYYSLMEHPGYFWRKKKKIFISNQLINHSSKTARNETTTTITGKSFPENLVV